MQRGDEAKQHARRDRRRRGKGKRPQVEMHRRKVHGAETVELLGPKCPLRIQRREEMYAPPGHGDARRAAKYRQEEALRQELPDESPARRPDRQAHGDLTLPR